MRLLIITQRVDMHDDNLSFFHGWIEKFSEKLNKVDVICLSKGKYDFSQNVKVYSMGKEIGISKFGQFFRLQRHLLKNLREVDGVFIHMCPIYAILSFPLTTLYGKKMVMWYTHKSRNWKVWLAEKLVNRILTASKESFRIKSKKIEILGHGIDTKLFCPGENNIQNINFTILTAGRIVPSKDLETQILALDILVNKENIKNISMKILGSEFPEEYPGYLSKIRKLIRERGLANYVFFEGSVQNKVMPEYYQNCDVFLNSSHTGSLDKAVLEAMACGVPVITSNEAFYDIVSSVDKKFFFKNKDANELARNIEYILHLTKHEYDERGARLRSIVTKEHNLDNLIGKIIHQFQ